VARRLDTFPRPAATRFGKYPWHEWTDGSVWEIKRGVDYKVSDSSMRSQLITCGIKARKKVRTARVEPGTLVFQFYEEGEVPDEG
jgi:hypothetical protein